MDKSKKIKKNYQLPNFGSTSKDLCIINLLQFARVII
jgi:hypothetical protein